MASTLFPESPPQPPKPAGSPDGRKAGATWVAATGAFLLLAAAAVFVAVRWDQLPEEAKVALVGALTGAFLAGGRALRRTLPATGDVLFHLGALLIPIDVAALSMRLDLGWRPLLLLEGLVGVGLLGALAAATGSVVLTSAAATSVAVLAAGVAAVTPAPAPLLLAGAAVVAHLLGRHRSAIFWAGMAGLAPVLGAAAMAMLRVSDVATGRGVLEELGLGGRAAALLAVVTGVASAVVLGREASRRRDLTLVALAATCLLSGAGTTWANADPSGEATFLAAAGLFLLVQVVAMLCQRDSFWARPARALGLAAEAVAAAVATPVAAALLLLAPFVEDGIDLFGDHDGWEPEPLAAVSWALVAGGWLLAAWRRLDRERLGPNGSPVDALRAALADDRTVVFLAAALGAAAVVGTASAIGIAVALVALAAALTLSRGVVATILAVAATLWAPLLVGPSHPLAAVPLGLAGAGVLGMAAVLGKDRAEGWCTAALGAGGSVVAFVGCAIGHERHDALGLPVVMALAAGAAWALAMAVERVSSMAGHVVRATMLLGLAGSMTGDPIDILPVAGLVTLLFALDAIRHDEPLISLGAALAAQVLVGATALAAELDPATTGVVLCASAAAFGGLAVPYPPRWRLPFVAAAAIGLAAGLPLASGDEARFAEALILTGAVAIAVGLVLREGMVAHGGGALASVGTAAHLVIDDVTVLEPYVGLVALQLVIAGWQLRRPGRDIEPLSSWIAYGPAIGLLGGAAIGERLSGGPAWHALLAGAVGVVAVAVGGWRRQAGPLFLGTALVGVATVVESLTTLAGVPTWAWLAAGGTVLLTVGVAMERSATSPVEAGRRLVDVVAERFT